MFDSWPIAVFLVGYGLVCALIGWLAGRRDRRHAAAAPAPRSYRVKATFTITPEEFFDFAAHHGELDPEIWGDVLTGNRPEAEGDD